MLSDFLRQKIKVGGQDVNYANRRTIEQEPQPRGSLYGQQPYGDVSSQQHMMTLKHEP
jgi:hypothetical protein